MKSPQAIRVTYHFLFRNYRGPEWIPEPENLEIKNSNGSITLENISSARCMLSTSNSAIICKGLSTGEMEAYSSNGAIALERVTAASIHTGTSNSAVDGNTLAAGEITVSNSNGYIFLSGISADILAASTSNSSNQLEDSSLANSVTLTNSNGYLGIDRVKAPNIDLSTSNSKISGVIDGTSGIILSRRKPLTATAA